MPTLEHRAGLFPALLKHWRGQRGLSQLDLALAAWLFSIRRQPRPAGHLFRYYLIGYAAIRFGLEFLRGDTGLRIGPFTAVQAVCVLSAMALVHFTRRDLGQLAPGAN